MKTNPPFSSRARPQLSTRRVRQNGISPYITTALVSVVVMALLNLTFIGSAVGAPGLILAKLPLAFEANEGQTDPQVKFLSRGRGYALFLTPDEVVLALGQRGEKPGPQSNTRGASSPIPQGPAALRLRFAGADPAPALSGLKALPGKVHYLRGTERRDWRTNVPTFAKVKYQNVYPGIDVVFYGNEQQLEFDFVVAPGTDPHAIKLNLDGADGVEIDSRGDLLVKVEGSEVVLHAPLVYQTQQGQRREIAGRYVVCEPPHGDERIESIAPRASVLDCGGPPPLSARRAPQESARGLAQSKTWRQSARFMEMEKSAPRTAASHLIGFEIAAYDPAKPLVIDPVLSYSTYLGGSALDQPGGMAADAFGNVYVVGTTAGFDFPTTNALKGISHGGSKIFISKIDASGTKLVFSTYLDAPFLGDPEGNWANGVAVDPAGNVLITGLTQSPRFPVVQPLFAYRGGGDAFVLKLNAAGSDIIFSTYLGGSAADTGTSVATDPAGNIYVAGFTHSADLPVTNAPQTVYGGAGTSPNDFGDGFVAKISADGSRLIYATYLGGSGGEQATKIAADASGNAYITGFTDSSNFPVTNAVQNALRGGTPGFMNDVDAFVTKIAPAGSALVYSTYLGGGRGDRGDGIAIDHLGQAYVVGRTDSSDFPTRNPFLNHNIGNNGFIAKLSANGADLVYSSLLADGVAVGTAVAVDEFGSAYVLGTSLDGLVPMVNPIQPTFGGGEDAFVMRVKPDGSGLDFSTFLGGQDSDVGAGIAVDNQGHLYVLGWTASTNFPVTNAIQPTLAGDRDCFIARIDFGSVSSSPPPQPRLFAATLIGASAEPPTPSAASGVGRFVLTGRTLSYDVTYSGLTSMPLGAHIHGGSLPTPGRIILGRAGGDVSIGSGHLIGSVDLDAAEASEFANGTCSFDLHTTAYPGGEIRGRITPGTNEPPRISFVSNQTISVNATGSVAFSVGDAETAAGNIFLSARSSNTNLLTPSSLTLGGAGANRMLTFRPLTNETGIATISLETTDAAGASTRTSFELRVVRNDENYDPGANVATLALQSPGPGSTVTGTITVSATARRVSRPEEIDAMHARGCSDESIASGACGIHYIECFIDGQQVAKQFVSDFSLQLDTARYANGPHELMLKARHWPDESIVLGLRQIQITVTNGRAPIELRPGWTELILAPGQSQAMAPRLASNNGEEETLTSGVTYSSADTGVATVNSTGLVQAVASGVTTITAAAAGLTNTTRVIVDPPYGFPHFGKDGAILTRYEPGRSLFTRSLFSLNQYEMMQSPALPEAVKRAGINALEHSFYNNPTDFGEQPDFETWRRNWESHPVTGWDIRERITRALDMSMVLNGDDVGRFAYELDNSINNPWSADAIRHALTRARDSGRVLGIEMIDETDFVWGDTPTPHDGRWLARSPSIPDDAFVRLMAIMNGVSNRPAITWPISLTGETAVRNWDGNPAFADYATVYWGIPIETYYPGGGSLPDVQTWMGTYLESGIKAAQRNKPIRTLVSISGPFYEKLGPGDHFVVGRDKLISGNRPQNVIAEIMFAAVSGVAGVRAYSYDWYYWKYSRPNDPIGYQEQTGADPFSVGTDRWDAMSKAFNLIQEIEPLLLQSKVNAVDMGKSIVTTARVGGNGKLLMALNMSELPQLIRANLQPFSATSDTIRYRLTLDGVVKETISARAVDELTLASGETVVWIFNRPVITWPPPADIVCGTALSGAQLNATANVPGTFTYSPPAGTRLNAATGLTLTVTFAPNDTNNYLSVTADVPLNVLKAVPVITWPQPPVSSNGVLTAQILNATANVAGTLVYSVAEGTILPAGSNQLLSVAFTPADPTSYHPVSATVRLDVLNGRPTLNAIPDRTAVEGSALSFSLAATDPDSPGQQLTFSLDNGALLGASVDASTGQFTWTPSEAQGGSIYTLTARVTDNGTPAQSHFQIFHITVNEVNSPPALNAIADQTINEHSPFTFTAVANDADLPANTLTFSLDPVAPAGATIDASTGVFTWTPTEEQGPGIYSVIIRVTDNGTPPLGATRSFTLTVNEANAAPTLAPIADRTVNEGSLLTFTLSAQDADPATADQVGHLLRELWFNVPGATLDDLTNVTKNPRWPDRPDETNYVTEFSTPPNIAENYGVRLSGLLIPPETGNYIFYIASDDQGALFLSTDDSPSHKVQIAAEPVWNGFRDYLGSDRRPNQENISAPIPLMAGHRYFVEALMKEAGVTDNLDIAWKLTSQVTPPANGSPPIPGTNLAVRFTQRTDAVPGLFRFSLEPDAPGGASVDSVTGVFTWTPTEDQGPGSYQITARVTDNGSPPLSDTRTFQVTVNEVNTAPTLAAIPNRTAYVGETVRITAAATDADRPTNRLTFSLSSGPAEATIDPTRGNFFWSPPKPGNYEFTARVIDNGSPPLSDERSFAITVVSAPLITSIVQEGDRVRLTFSAIPDRSYRLQYKSNLDEAAWTDLGAAVTADGQTASLQDTPGLARQRFYRVFVLP